MGCIVGCGIANIEDVSTKSMCSSWKKKSKSSKQSLSNKKNALSFNNDDDNLLKVCFYQIFHSIPLHATLAMNWPSTKEIYCINSYLYLVSSTSSTI